MPIPGLLGACLAVIRRQVDDILRRDVGQFISDFRSNGA